MSARNRKIKGKLYTLWLREFWDDPDFAKNTLDERAVYWYVSSNRRINIAGAYSMDVYHIVFQTKITSKEFFKRLKRLPQGKVYKEKDTKNKNVWWFFVPATMKIQVKGEKQLIGAKNVILELPDRLRMKKNLIVPYYNNLANSLEYPNHTL